MTHILDAAYNMVWCSQESMHKANLPAGEQSQGGLFSSAMADPAADQQLSVRVRSGRHTN